MKIDWFTKMCLGIIAFCLLYATFKPVLPMVGVDNVYLGGGGKESDAAAIYLDGGRIECDMAGPITIDEIKQPVPVETDSFDTIRVDGEVKVDGTSNPIRVRVE